MLTIGLSLALTGVHAELAREAEQGLRLFVQETNAGSGISIGGARCEIRLRLLDDGGDPGRCAEIYRALCFDERVDLLFGPFTSATLRAAAPIAEQARTLMINHGGALDPGGGRDRHGMVVSVAAPAADYLKGVAKLLATLKMFRKRVALIYAGGPFGAAVVQGFEDAVAQRAIRWHGVRVRLKYRGTIDAETPPVELTRALRRNRINAIISAGDLAHDIASMRAAIRSDLYIPVVACVGAGLNRFGRDMGAESEGVVGVSQWEETMTLKPELGPPPAQFARRLRAFAPGSMCEYMAARSYGAGLLSKAAIERAGSTDTTKLRAVLGAMRTITTFGEFAIDSSGRQTGHRMLLVQWHDGRKVVIDPVPPAEQTAVEFPSGLRILLEAIHVLSPRAHTRVEGREEVDDED
jgi:branched-chain amino acid transport system substrate-binding protein